MQTEIQQKYAGTPSPVQNSTLLEKIAYRLFLALVVLLPVVFLPTAYNTLDIIKSTVFIVGVIALSVLYAVLVFREKRLSLPSRKVTITLVLLLAVAVISAAISLHPMKAFFGQGFETGTVGYLFALMLSVWVTYETIRRDQGRAGAVITFVQGVFLAFAVFHAIRIFLPQYTTLGILGTVTDTVFGRWFELSIFAIAVLIFSLNAVLSLPLSKKQKIFNYIVIAFALLTAFLVNYHVAWFAAIIVFAAASIISYRGNRRIPWWNGVILLVALVLFFYGGSIAGRVVDKTGTGYTELNLPWQMTIDVISGSIKNYPFFGVGPNHFGQAFMTYKPVGFNETNLWTVEFNSGFGLIPTYVATLGMTGTVLWILFLVLLGAAILQSLRSLPGDPNLKYVVTSTALATAFLWITALSYVPSQSLLFLNFAITGMYFASAAKAGSLKPFEIQFSANRVSRILMPVLTVIFLIVLMGCLVVYGKKSIAHAYLAHGVTVLNAKADYDAADRSFKKALAFDKSDAYWRAVSENDRLKIISLVNTATSSSEALTKSISDTFISSIEAAKKAIEYNPANYYNLLSEARISQLGISLKVENAYENAVRAYGDAINIYPQNPALYVNLAQLQASNNKLDDALRTLGRALQVKNNYLDAVYLLSQVHAARNDLNNAIIAAKVAIQLDPRNPPNPLLYFQLGMLEYNAKNYGASLEALKKAVEIQPDYANAKYFYGLAAARQNDIPTALQQFADLSRSNPENQEIAQILTTLQSGRSLFAPAETAVASKAEKRPTLPVKEKR